MSGVDSAKHRIQGNSLGAQEFAHEFGHAHLVLPFPICALLLGAFTKHVLDRKCPSFPYTCVLLVEGLLLGVLHQYTGTQIRTDEHTLIIKHHLGPLSDSINLWATIEPRLLMSAFLPALLFGDCMGMTWHMLKRCFTQMALLATLGVVQGCLLTGLVLKLILPIKAHWTQSFMYGSILAATDPVAVVAIMKDVGCSPRLTMLISGESLLNDGTAIVLFNSLLAMTERTPESLKVFGVSKWEDMHFFVLVKYFLYMIVVSTFVGMLMGLIGVFWIGLASRKTSHDDVIIQVCISLTIAYLTYEFADFHLETSGVLAVVTAAVTLAYLVWPQVTDRDTMESVWHMIEFMANTLLFLLSGVLITAKLIHRGIQYTELDWGDLRCLFLLYIAINLIRFLMIFTFYFPLKHMGYGFDMRDAVVLGWAGLRGAVGLALALEVDMTYRKNTLRGEEESAHEALHGTKILFYVGGIAVLTLLINGTTCSWLLRVIGLTQTDVTTNVLQLDINARIKAHCEQIYEDSINSGCARSAMSKEELRELVEKKCSVLRTSMASSAEPDYKARRRASFMQAMNSTRKTSAKVAKTLTDAVTDTDGVALVAVRELFLHTLRQQYFDQVEKGVLPQDVLARRILSASVDVAMDHVREGLYDLDAVMQQCKTGMMHLVKMACFRVVNTLCPRRFVHLQGTVAAMGVNIDKWTLCYVLTCFVQAHNEAQLIVKGLLEDDNNPSRSQELRQVSAKHVEWRVLDESRQAVCRAQKVLDGLDTTSKRWVAVDQACSVVLDKQQRHIQQLLASGLLDESEAHHLLEQVGEDRQRLKSSSNPNSARGRIETDFLSNRLLQRVSVLSQEATPAAPRLGEDHQ